MGQIILIYFANFLPFTITAGSVDIRPAFKIDLNPPPPPCVAEARKEANESMEVVAFAEELAKTFPNAPNIDKISKGALLLRQLIQSLHTACDNAEKNPFDDVYIKEIEAMRLKLKNAAATILQYASEIGAEQDAALATNVASNPKEKEAVSAIEAINEIMQALEAMLSRLDSLKGEEFVKMAQEIAAKVKFVTNIMQQKAGTLQGKEKERMFGLSKVLFDSSIRGRILATVIAADKDANQNRNCTTENGDSFIECTKVLLGDMRACKALLEETTLRATADVRRERMRKMMEILKAKYSR